MLTHSFEPVFNSDSRILILGTFPSVASRAFGFYYGHPQNRFWRVLAAVLETDIPSTAAEKTTFLLSHRIALWDVVQSCEIDGSSDASIRSVIPNDLNRILRRCDIRAICLNGRKAEALYRRFTSDSEQSGQALIPLPSTSPANASYSTARLTDAWKIILDSLG